MTDGQSECCELNGPWPDMPFGPEGERERERIERECEDEETVISKLKRRIAEFEEKARNKRNDC